MDKQLENNETAARRESVMDLLVELVKSSAVMVHNEIELVLQSIREKSRFVLGGALMMAMGVLVGFTAFVSFCVALTIWLSLYMTLLLAVLLTGAVLALCGTVIIWLGYSQLHKNLTTGIPGTICLARSKQND